ncbi:phytase [Altererythrobacter fulvus]|uniref:phytase n=1 Tax=Caenibius fulvus TaxID=2126012 RepID=UPI0030169C47
MRVGKTALIVTLAGALGACSTTPPVNSWPAAPVFAQGETVPVGTGNADAADDPAIWRNAVNPEASLVIGTDKKAGLYVYGLDGQVRDFHPDGRLNNVDLKDMGSAGVIVAASDRNDIAAAQIRLYRLDTANAKLMPLGAVPGGAGEGYGICLLEQPDGLHAFSVLKDGKIEEFRLELGATPASVPVRTMKLPTQTEGCVADPRDGTLYVGEEDVGIWRFAAGATQGELVARNDNLQLVSDTEGLAILPKGENGGWLVASSQGDNTYAVFHLPGMEPAGRFRIAEGAFGSAEETDGIDLHAGDFGPKYPNGLFVAQDGHNGTRAQNFKLVSWADIEKALETWTAPPATN